MKTLETNTQVFLVPTLSPILTNRGLSVEVAPLNASQGMPILSLCISLPDRFNFYSPNN